MFHFHFTTMFFCVWRWIKIKKENNVAFCFSQILRVFSYGFHIVSPQAIFFRLKSTRHTHTFSFSFLFDCVSEKKMWREEREGEQRERKNREQDAGSHRTVLSSARHTNIDWRVRKTENTLTSHIFVEAADTWREQNGERNSLAFPNYFLFFYLFPEKVVCFLCTSCCLLCCLRMFVFLVLFVILAAIQRST